MSKQQFNKPSTGFLKIIKTHQEDYEQTDKLRKKVPDWDRERRENSLIEGETLELGFLKLRIVFKGEILELFTAGGDGDGEIPKGIVRISWMESLSLVFFSSSLTAAQSQF